MSDLELNTFSNWGGGGGGNKSARDSLFSGSRDYLEDDDDADLEVRTNLFHHQGFTQAVYHFYHSVIM
jgi:hypothetical protein